MPVWSHYVALKWKTQIISLQCTFQLWNLGSWHSSGCDIQHPTKHCSRLSYPPPPLHCENSSVLDWRTWQRAWGVDLACKLPRSQSNQASIDALNQGWSTETLPATVRTKRICCQHSSARFPQRTSGSLCSCPDGSKLFWRSDVSGAIAFPRTLLDTFLGLFGSLG